MKEDSFAIGIIETPQDEYINKTWLVQKLNEAVTEIKEKVPDQPDYATIVETLAQTINKIQPADVVEVRLKKLITALIMDREVEELNPVEKILKAKAYWHFANRFLKEE